MSDGGTQEARSAGDWKCRSKVVGWLGKENPPGYIQGLMGSPYGDELIDATLPRKASSQQSGACTANRHR